MIVSTVPLGLLSFITMLVESAEVHTFTAPLDCRYLLHTPEVVDDRTVLVLALHGYGSNPETMLRLMTPLVGIRHIVACLQGPNQHYQTAPAANATAAYNWGIRDHWDSSVRLHHEMVTRTLETLRNRFRLPRERCLLAGFSQPVGLNYRFAGTFPEELGGVMGICGGVPRDWEEDKYQPLKSAILHISRDDDEFYPVEIAAEFPNRLKKHAHDVEFHLIPGQHRFPSKADGIVRPWIDRVFHAHR